MRAENLVTKMFLEKLKIRVQRKSFSVLQMWQKICRLLDSSGNAEIYG